MVLAFPVNLDHGLGAELVTQARLSDPRALYDLPGWAEQCTLPTLYPEIERTGQVNDDRAGQSARAGSATVACLNAGSTSVPKRSSCSRATARGTPTDRLTEIRSRPG